VCATVIVHYVLICIFKQTWSQPSYVTRTISLTCYMNLSLPLQLPPFWHFLSKIEEGQKPNIETEIIILICVNK